MITEQDLIELGFERMSDTILITSSKVNSNLSPSFKYLIPAAFTADA